MINASDYVPLILFMVIFFMAFSFLQTVIVFLIKRYAHKHWQMIVDTLLSKVVHHKILIRSMSMVSLAVVFTVLVYLTPIFDILVGGQDVVRILGGILVLEMIIVFFISDKAIQVTIAKRIHLYVYILLSLISFTGMMLVAEGSYSVYEASINKTIVEPIVESIEGDYEQRVEDSLIALVRDKVKAGECPFYDYAESEVSGGITQFVFLKDDPALKDPEAPEKRSPDEAMAGKRCIHETTLLLSPQGKWYQVLEQGL